MMKLYIFLLITLLLIALLILLVLPKFLSSYVLGIFIMIFFYAYLGQSWNILTGYTGVISLGYSLYVGIGAYMTFLLTLTLGLSPWIGMWIGGVAAGLIGSNLVASQVFRTDLLNPVPPNLNSNDDIVASDHLPVVTVFRYPDPPLHLTLALGNATSRLSWPALIGRRFSVETMGDDKRPVVWFDEVEKGLGLNITNDNTIEEICGSADPAKWPGHKVVLYKTQTDFKGTRTDCIRVRAPKPGAVPQKPEPKFGDEDESVPL